MSIGRSHKIPGIKIGRMHHVLSDRLLVLEFQRNVLDIREQFPLLPTELSERAATSLAIRHPTHRGTESQRNSSRLSHFGTRQAVSLGSDIDQRF